VPEARLRKLLLRCGFPPFDAQKRIPLPHRTYKSTTPDLLREDPVSNVKVAVYLDGLSKNIHGNEERQKIDTLIRNQLRCQEYEVVEIAVSELDDPELLKSHLRFLAHALNMKDIGEKIDQIDLEREIREIDGT
jgi:hypothetical protein